METKEVGYAWNYTADFGNNTAFSLSGNFVTGMSKEEMKQQRRVEIKVFEVVKSQE